MAKNIKTFLNRNTQLYLLYGFTIQSLAAGTVSLFTSIVQAELLVFGVILAASLLWALGQWIEKGKVLHKIEILSIIVGAVIDIYSMHLLW
jgi:hypothetical protein